MRDMLNGVMALGRMQSQSNPQVQALMQSVTLGGSGRTIELTFNVPSELIDAVMPKAKVKQIAANWGMPESVFDLSYQATSGFEIELKRTALREIRRDQILDLRPVEREFAQIQSAVLSAAAHPLRFGFEGWRIDFGEIETPSDPMQALAYFEKRRQLGLTNTIEMILKENPEFTEDDAYEALINNVRIESQRVEMMRALNMSMAASSDEPGVNPEDQDDDEQGDAANVA
jgi:hypothetical protein